MKLFTHLNSLKKTKLVFFFLGISSVTWFLIRVIPKPSRAAYPCMQASAPVMSAFVVYLIGLASTVYIFKKEKRSLLYSRFTMASLFIAVALFSFSSTEQQNQFSIVDASYFQANAPVGEAKGIFPGRVVWVYDQNVTNAEMADPSANDWSDYWALDKNCNQVLVDSMLTSGIRRIGGKSDIKDAWDGIFKYYNNNHGKGFVGYTNGEKFAIKVNLTNSSCNCAGPKRMDSTPQVLLAILHQLVDVVGVPQDDIWIGDSYRTFRDEYYSKCHSEYPDVHYVDGQGGNGREKTIPSADQLLKFSDGIETSSIPMHYVDAEYFINIPCLKSHDSAGITLAAKNHQGSVLESGTPPEAQSAMYMHPYFPQKNANMGVFRHLVDYMGHEELGGKTLLYIIDGIWAGRSWQGYLEKWQMSPFNNDYPSSLFLSQDAVAIESVCYDFLLAEYASKPTDQKFPYMSGTDDYLRQASDPINWPAGIQYDPEGDGSNLVSLGVYEHWNNVTEKQYSRNLGTGSGIELKKYTALAADNYTDEITGGLLVMDDSSPVRIYPNPFSDLIHIEMAGKKDLILRIYDVTGKLIFSTVFETTYTWNVTNMKDSQLKKGTYILNLMEKSSAKVLHSEKIIYY